MRRTTRSTTAAVAASENQASPQTAPGRNQQGAAALSRKRQALQHAPDQTQPRPWRADECEELCHRLADECEELCHRFAELLQKATSATIPARCTITPSIGNSQFAIEAEVTVQAEPFIVEFQASPLAKTLPVITNPLFVSVHSTVPQCITVVFDAEGTGAWSAKLHISNATDFVRVVALLEGVQHPTPLLCKTVRTSSGVVGVVTSSAEGGNVVMTVLQPSMRRLTVPSDDLTIVQ